jgi:peptidoglycan hydrolase CwlO-like protein
MIIHAPISIGELIDKITILKIKSILIVDTIKLKNIEQELQLLEELKDSLNIDIETLEPLQYKLYGVNLELWHIENYKRECEKNQNFDDKFIETARQVYLKNDIRAKIKHSINTLFGSTIVEEKSY